MRLPVAAWIALHSAGGNGGVGGSPTPPGGAVLSTICTSMLRGAWGMRIRELPIGRQLRA